MLNKSINFIEKLNKEQIHKIWSLIWGMEIIRKNIQFQSYIFKIVPVRSTKNCDI